VIERLASWDSSLFFFLNSTNALWLNPIMVFFSSQLIWIPLILFIFLLSYRELPKKQLFLFILFLLLSIIASDATSSYIFKNIFKRLRPCRVEEIKLVMNSFGQKCGGRFGFVSSHAANSFVLLSFFFSSLKNTKKIYHLAWILPFVVSYSRIYLGVHFPADVTVGALIGIVWGIVFSSFFKTSKLRGQSS